MRIRNRTTFGFAFGVALLLAFAVAGSDPSVAEELGLAVPVGRNRGRVEGGAETAGL
jgi:hypothetical protein